MKQLHKFIAGWLLVTMCAAMRAAIADDGSLDLEEIVVTGTPLSDAKLSLPATVLKRPADYLLLQVAVSNDSRSYTTRRDEIYATLRLMQTAAEKDRSIQLSVIRDQNLVLPLKLDDAVLGFDDTQIELSTVVSVKTPVGLSHRDETQLLSKLRNFIAGIKPVGRTQLEAEKLPQVTVVNIAQYRDKVVQLFAEDVKKLTSALGGDYRIVARGLDHPLQWARSGTLDVVIFVPYQYEVMPISLASLPATRAHQTDPKQPAANIGLDE